MFTTPFYWLIAPIYRRLRYITMADFFRERYGKSLAIFLFYTFYGIIFFCMIIGIMLKGTGITLEGLTSGAIPEGPIIIIATVLFVVYGLAGGIVAATVTDLVQGVLILVLSFLLLPFAVNKAGGMTAFHQGLPEYMFSLVAPHEVTLFFVVMAVLNGLVGIVIQPHHMAVGGSGKTEMACRIGWTYGNFVKRFATMGWAFIGVFAAFLFPGLIMENRELAFGIAARNLLPVGFIGLMIASLIAAAMSSCDAFMVHASALYTRNFYLPYINPKADDKQLLKVGRLTSMIVVAGGIIFAFAFPSVVHGLKEVWKACAYLGVAFWIGVIWKGANRYGAWSSALVMTILSILTGNVFGWNFPNQVALYLPIGILTMIIVSRFTSSEPAEKLRQFYALLNTPVGKEKHLKESGVEIMLEGISEEKKSKAEKFLEYEEVEDGLLITDLLSLSKKFSWKRYRTDILGFFGAVLLSIIMILVMIVLAKIGG